MPYSALLSFFKAAIKPRVVNTPKAIETANKMNVGQEPSIPLMHKRKTEAAAKKIAAKNENISVKKLTVLFLKHNERIARTNAGKINKKPIVGIPVNPTSNKTGENPVALVHAEYVNNNTNNKM